MVSTLTRSSPYRQPCRGRMGGAAAVWVGDVIAVAPHDLDWRDDSAKRGELKGPRETATSRASHRPLRGMAAPPM